MRQTKFRYITEHGCCDNLKSRSSKFFHKELTYTRTDGLSTPTAPHTELRNNGTLP